MKLLHFGEPGKEKPGLLDREGKIRDLSGVVTAIGPEQLSKEALAALAQVDPESLPLVPGDPRIGPCVLGVPKFICVGLNYTDHAEEAGMAVPKEPILFMKAISAISGPNDAIELPPGSEKTDWEVELGVVIGQTARHVTRDAALDHVAGYCTVNDVSERAYQIERGGQWVKGKSYDSFGPIGPWLVTAEEVADPQNLALWLEVNGTRYQDGNTANQIFPVAEVISHISQFMTLQPGDVISTGTPAGVGMGFTPAIYLREGDVVSLGVEGLGEQRQIVMGD
ncbi:fumarylacetoacetate hydrolase family protein [Rhodovibrionaceae bacterium A322]